MSEEYKNRLKGLLRSLFQFDSADLDFGIYRIMNKKRDEIEQFIEKDLIDAVDAELGKYSDSKQVNLKEDVEAIKAEIHEKLGDDALDETENIKKILVTTPFAKELDERYKKARASMKYSEISSQYEAEIFSHIYQFFSRYYDKGDFMSLRRYSQKEKYAIPYNGEEVVLHWANKDQYYIKTGEHFKNYSFKIGAYTVEFRILQAEGTINNNKAENRFFVPSSSDPVYDASKKLLTIFFEYRGLNKDEENEYGTKNVPDAIITKMKGAIPSQVQEEGLKAALNKIVDTETDKTLLEKHLRAYTQRNTTDYFIHKDLKGFLIRELDFYIKNEVFHLDDLGTENEEGVAQYMSRMRVIKSICLKIIDFLSQIEDFQKMLFEKKKFVVRTDYCMTIDNVPPDLYPEILKNKDQLNEWKALYGAGEEKQSSITSFGSKSIDEAYLKENPYLTLDTKFFNLQVKDELLASFDDLDEATGGLMIKSENWQALNLMQEKYREKVKCIYIDPPYNTGSDEFIYKDNYQHSSWLTMMENRLKLSKDVLQSDGIIFISIDDGEQPVLRSLMDSIYGNDKFVANIVWQKKYGPANDARGFSPTHDHVISYSKSFGWVPILIPRTEEQLQDYKNPDNDPRGSWRASDLSAKTPSKNCMYPITIPSGKTVLPPANRSWIVSKERYEELLTDNRISFGMSGEGRPMVKKFLSEVREGITPETWWSRDFAGDNKIARYEIKNISPENLFDSPKPKKLISRICQMATKQNDILLDFFAGSGTTADAVLDLSTTDEIKRKYVLVEMGDYFDNVMKSRIQKIMYSKNWKDGKPQSNDGISHIFKYQYLEQYEDTLNNIEFKDAGSYQRTLSEMDGYFLRYMLDFETGDSSPCRFNVEKLTKPFDYTLKITHGNELKDEKVDLVETFNYLLGIYVRQIRTFSSNGTYYRVVFGKKNEDEIAIIWRDTDNLDLKALQADKAFIEGTILNGIKPSKIYINADFYVEGALPIEPEFKKLMVV